MILNLYVIHESGVCIFKREYTKETEIDEQLISGFLMAVRSFAQQTFLDGLQRVQLASGRTLVYGYNKEYGILAAALADKKDNPLLVERIVNQIVDLFINKYRSFLKPLNPNVDLYEDFKKDLDKFIVKKIRSRDALTISAAIIMALLISITVTYLTVSYLSYLAAPIQLFIPVAVASAIGGYMGGNLKIGILSGLVSTLPILLLLSTALVGLTTITLTIEDFIFVTQTLIGPAVIIGAASGYFVDLTRLYPLETLK